MHAYVDRESQNKSQKSLLAWCMIYYNSRVFFDCGRSVHFKQFEQQSEHTRR